MPVGNLASILLVLLVGALVATQPGVNGQLSRRLGSPIEAAVVSFGTGFVTLVAVTLVMRRRLPTPAQVLEAPSWMWLGGGLLGATFVTTALIVAPRIGATLFFSLIVAGQMGGALVLDHMGWVGFPKDPISLGKVVGVALVVGGVALVARS